MATVSFPTQKEAASHAHRTLGHGLLNRSTNRPGNGFMPDIKRGCRTAHSPPRVGQNRIYTVYIHYSLLGYHQLYGWLRCICTYTYIYTCIYGPGQPYPHSMQWQCSLIGIAHTHCRLRNKRNKECLLMEVAEQGIFTLCRNSRRMELLLTKSTCCRMLCIYSLLFIKHHCDLELSCWLNCTNAVQELPSHGAATDKGPPLPIVVLFYK